jgi:2-polyprenyl-3-methyl-5-hydroxy-6-metoxy-1,4-benzoquinol methylase
MAMIVDTRDELSRSSGDCLVKDMLRAGMIVPGEKVLDFGAGEGRLAIPLSAYCSVKVVDAEHERLERLKQIGFEVAVEDEEFDLAIAFFVLQHQSLANARELTTRLSRRVKRFVFTYPTYEILEFRPKTDLEWVPLAEMVQQPVPDCNDLSGVCHESEIRSLFKGSGFDVRTLRYIETSTGNHERLREIRR